MHKAIPATGVSASNALQLEFEGNIAWWRAPACDDVREIVRASHTDDIQPLTSHIMMLLHTYIHSFLQVIVRLQKLINSIRL